MAEFKSLEDLIQEVITALSQVPGTGVQTYAEDRIAQAIAVTYNSVSRIRQWPWLHKWQSRTIDGSTGKPTQRLTSVARAQDIVKIHNSQSQTPLPMIGPSLNPYMLGGTVAQYVEWLHPDDDSADADGNKYLFRVWPLASTDTVYIYARTTVADLFDDPQVEVPFDWITLMNGAAMDIVADDGNDPVSLDKFRLAFVDALKLETNEYDRQPLVLDARTPIYSADNWRELD